MGGLCKDCKQWRKDESRGSAYVGMFAPKQEGWRYCALTEYGEEARGKAIALDNEDYFAVLHTAPDFGCVQWASKNEESA